MPGPTPSLLLQSAPSPTATHPSTRMRRQVTAARAGTDRCRRRLLRRRHAPWLETDFCQKTHALPTRSFKAKRIGAPTTREPKREGGNNNSKASNSGTRVNPSAGFRIETATLRRSEAAPDHARPSTQAHRQTWRRALRRAFRRHGGWPYYDVCGIRPPAKPWMWSLAYGQHEDRTPTHGYEPTREAAMQAFARSWNRD